MANFFDQFDTAATSEMPSSGNFFDQFDEQPKGQAGLVGALQRTWEEPPKGLSLIGLAKKIVGGVTLPSEVYSGKVPLPPTGDIPEEVIHRSADLAAGATLSTAPGGMFAAPRGSLGMGFAKPGAINAKLSAEDMATLQQMRMSGATTEQVVEFLRSRTPPVSEGAAIEGRAFVRDAEGNVYPSPANPTPVIEAGQRIGVDLPRYMVDESRMTQGLAEGLKNIPGAGDKIAKAAEETVGALGSAATKAAEGYGTGSPAVAGSYAKDALVDWIENGGKAVADRLYGSVDKLVNPDVRSSLSATAKTTAEIMERRGASYIPGKSAAVEIVREAVEAPSGLTYEGIKGLRTFLGEMTPQELVSQGLKGSEVKQLYGALTNDLRRSVIEAGGQPALVAFEKANRVYQMIAQRRETLLKLIGAKGDASPEAVYSRLLAMAGSKSSADIGRLTAARKTMGAEAWNEVAAAAVARMGRDPQGEFSIQRFLTAYGNMSPDGRAAMFRTTGRDDLARSLDDIAFVSEHVKGKLAQFYNPSGTAKSLMSTQTVLGIIHAPIKTLTTMLGGARMARILSEPASARATADWIKAYREVVINPADIPRSRAAMAASEKLAGFIARETGVSEQAALQQLLATPVGPGAGGTTPQTPL